MARRIQWTPVALEDLTAARDYIAADSRRAADKVVQAIRDLVRSLRELPFQGHLVAEFDQPNLRQVSVYNYRVIYRVVDADIQSLGVIHGARDLKSLWDREGRPT